MAMDKSINVTGVQHLIDKIKALFVAKADTHAVSTVGVDATPTANSSNLVTSGGVKTYVDGLVGDIESTINAIRGI